MRTQVVVAPGPNAEITARVSKIAGNAKNISGIRIMKVSTRPSTKPETMPVSVQGLSAFLARNSAGKAEQTDGPTYEINCGIRTSCGENRMPMGRPMARVYHWRFALGYRSPPSPFAPTSSRPINLPFCSFARNLLRKPFKVVQLTRLVGSNRRSDCTNSI